MAQMATLTGKQANEYLNARPTYPTIWYKVLAGRTSNHKVAWDVGTGNGQAALGVCYLFHLLCMFLFYSLYSLLKNVEYNIRREHKQNFLLIFCFNVI